MSANTPDLPASEAVMPDREDLMPMRTVASMTGLKPVTLRAWERRYGLVKPRRAAGGHRLYSRAEVDLLRRVVRLLEGGLSIGHVAGLVAADTFEAGTDAAAQPTGQEALPPSVLIARLLAGIESLDEVAVDAAYTEAMALYPVETVAERIITPALRALGRRWARRQGGIAEEHFFTVFLRNRLGADMQQYRLDARGPRLLAACMPGDRHDLGLLMFCQVATRRGYRVTSLGGAVPLDELAAACSVSKADAIVLSVSVVPAGDALDGGLARLVGAVPVPVMVGGALSERFRDTLTRAGAAVLGDTMESSFAALRSHLPPPRPNVVT